MSILYSTGLITKLFGEQSVDTGANGLRGLLKTGCIRVYSGAQPVSADAAVTGTLLGTITVAGATYDESAGTNGISMLAPSGRTLSKAAEVWKYTGAAAGTMGWFRYQGKGADDDTLSTSFVRIDGSVGITSGDLRLTSVTSAINSSATIDTFVITAA